MENSPARIAADILIGAFEAKTLLSNSPSDIAAAFTEIHKAVHDAAKKDREQYVGHRMA